MVTAYLPYVMLLLASPIIGKYSLQFVYPEIKTYLRKRKWLLFIVFGLVAYVPTAVISLSEVVMPLYSPLGASPLLFEYEGSTVFTLFLFLGVLVLNSSVVEYAMVRRRETRVVGIPKHVIRYGIKKEMKEAKKKERNKEITKITKDLESIVKEEKDVRPLLEKIRESVAKERVKKGQVEEARELLSHKVEAPEPPAEKEEGESRQELIMELEAKLRKATKDTDDEGRSEELLSKLKEKITYEEPEEKEEYAEADVDEITDALKQLREKVGKEEEAEISRHRHRRTGEKPEEQAKEDLAEYFKGRPQRGRRGRGGDDILKEVVGDVRQQLREPEEEEEGEGETRESRWYEKGPKPGAAAPEAAVPGEEPGIEMFESGLEFDEGLGGDLGELGSLEDELGDFGELEGLDQDLGTSDFDGMFVEMGEGTKGGCPNCGKKGTSIVYCSSCGKPMCSNCAASVDGSEEYVKYKCPHCDEEFAMKRRLPA